MTASDAKEYGIIDEVLEPQKLADLSIPAGAEPNGKKK
jgi:hypothetical protein